MASLVMIYNNIRKGQFISRPNRFIAKVEIEGKIEACHVKNTGRCKELLISGVTVYVDQAVNFGRATKYDLVSVYKGEQLVNIDSQAPNKVFLEHLQSDRYIEDVTHIQAEVKHGTSRFDFYVEAGQRKIFVEVKGVTLEEDGVALFPDAPTLRGVKHLNELIVCIKDGYEAHVVFVIQMCGPQYFTPNNKTHSAFGRALIAAKAAGVKITALDCMVTENALSVRDKVPIKLDSEEFE
jgi:sugar fermentation stimulation protein A